MPPTVPGVVRMDLLDVGGTATVYRAFDEARGVHVAVKIGRPRSGTRLAREGAALRRLGPPTTPEWIGEGRTVRDEPFLVMELLHGRPLSDWMAARPGSGAAPLNVVIELVGALASAVDRVHGADIVHRDLKPENVFLRAGAARWTERLVVVDFGIARFAAEPDPPEPGATGLVANGHRVGTLTYMAPEQLVAARRVDARADVYSLGVMTYELLTGHPPFTGDAAAVIEGHAHRLPLPPSRLVPIPPAVDTVVLRALAKDPACRPATAGALAADLRAAARLVAAAT